MFFIKCITVSAQMFSSTTVFNIANNDKKKKILSSKSEHYSDFWKIMWLWTMT